MLDLVQPVFPAGTVEPRVGMLRSNAGLRMGHAAKILSSRCGARPMSGSGLGWLQKPGGQFPANRRNEPKSDISASMMQMIRGKFR